MRLHISSPEVQQFIFDHEHDDEKELILKHKEILGIPSSQIANQIAGRRKAKEKLPSFYETRGVIYPPSINLEQSSSEDTAQLKTRIILNQVKNFRVCVDLTGGFGVDSLFFARIFKKVIYVDPNNELLELAKHNHSLFGNTKVEYQNSTAEKIISSLDNVDLIYIDPSRRSNNKKVFSLHDSEPNVVDLQSAIFEKTEHILIKTSPLLDIQAALNNLKFTSSVNVVAVDNEVKELLFLLKRNFSSEPSIVTSNIRKNSVDNFNFQFSFERSLEIPFSNPQAYLYEPNAAILKAGAFKSIAKAYNLQKLAPSTHLYTSEQNFKDFPGRIFKVIEFVKPDPKKIQEVFPDQKANVITRNYPLSVDELKKKMKLKDGGEKYLIGFSGQKEKFLCAAERIK